MRHLKKLGVRHPVKLRTVMEFECETCSAVLSDHGLEKHKAFWLRDKRKHSSDGPFGRRCLGLLGRKTCHGVQVSLKQTGVNVRCLVRCLKDSEQRLKILLSGGIIPQAVAERRLLEHSQ